MQCNDILIIGAGATGLMAARLLAKNGKTVTVLEARNRCGGRIHTLHNESFFTHAELGAEFVHGDLPVTLNLLNEAGIPYHHAGGEMWHYQNGKFDADGGAMPNWDLLMKYLNELKQDTNIHNFLQEHFPEEKYVELRISVEKYASGYDTADPRQASAFALRNEWQNEDEGAQHRIQGGYAAMITYLEEEFKTAGGNIIFNSPVKAIHWQTSKVHAITNEGTIYEAEQVLVALPLGVLQIPDNQMGSIIFAPLIPQQTKAIQAMGFGAIIKVLLEFDEIFWEDGYTENLAGKSTKDMGFILSDQAIPTWWTQAPLHSPILTGWLGGPAANEKKNTTEGEILQLSLESIAKIFKRDEQWLKDKLVAYNIVNWTAAPYTRGSYAYDTVEAPASRLLLNQSVQNTLFFAGEYLYEGAAMGTVEAALTSGKNVAEKIIKT
jgi:monoamine oxidase